MPETIQFQSFYSAFLRERMLQTKITTATFIHFRREILYRKVKKKPARTPYRTNKSQQEEAVFEHAHNHHKSGKSSQARLCRHLSQHNAWCAAAHRSAVWAVGNWAGPLSRAAGGAGTTTKPTLSALCLSTQCNASCIQVTALLNSFLS